MVASNEQLDMEDLGSMYKQSKAVRGSMGSSGQSHGADGGEEGEAEGRLMFDLEIATIVKSQNIDFEITRLDLCPIKKIINLAEGTELSKGMVMEFSTAFEKPITALDLRRWHTV